MGLKVDSKGAYRAGKRFKSMATKLDQAEALAASDLARRLIPEFARQATALYNLKASRIRETSNVQRNGTAVSLIGYHRETGLLNFGAKASRTQGVTVVLERAQGPQRFKHAFKATGLSGNAQIFERDVKKAKREMKYGRYVGKKRQPIKAMYGKSTAQILRDQDVHDGMTKFAHKQLAAEIRRQLGRL